MVVLGVWKCFILYFSRFLPRPGLPRRHSSYSSRQACERVENSWEKNYCPLRRESAAGRHRFDRRRTRLLRDGPGKKTEIFYFYNLFSTNIV